MNARTSVIALAAIAVGGCAPLAWHGDPNVPHAGGQLEDPGRCDPWVRLEATEHRVRDVAGNFEEHAGLDRLRYPTTGKLAMAWSYVLAGRDFEARGEHAEAARAGWAALAVTRRALGSRLDRERIKRAAYADLAKAARAKKQPEWAGLLKLCADLAGAYLASPQARADDAAFYAEIERLEEAERQALAAAREAERQQTRELVSGIISQTSAQLSTFKQAASSNPQVRAEGERAMLEANLKGAQMILDLDQKEGDANRALAEALTKVGAGAAKFRAVAADDVAEVEAGSSFVAIEAAAYLAAAKTTEPYALVLRSFAKGRPALASAIEKLPVAGAPELREEKIARVAKGLRAIEVEVAKCERRGRPCKESDAGR